MNTTFILRENVINPPPHWDLLNLTEMQHAKIEVAQRCWEVIDLSRCCDFYFIGASINDNLTAVKIGISKDCEQRLASLQSCTFIDLKILGYYTFTSVEQARYLEKEAHVALHPYKIKGEWYQPHPNVINYHPLFL